MHMWLIPELDSRDSKSAFPYSHTTAHEQEKPVIPTQEERSDRTRGEVEVGESSTPVVNSLETGKLKKTKSGKSSRVLKFLSGNYEKKVERPT
ncbi:hypothetical protein GLAREA_01431 [Glarea lozoyensis ATCC 20868]|uniref:Uncharacterized protein n=1 Tax=Glarea lozoyensis (strain ATCC 20868 / MF5171) TaxID=1116229 RepID=S3CJV3_GLAL2|nr:uncharacterized protein GLAREA_01431 [Glarea lozoyensis ATCC 20868]EPE25519.1 hypothetical protein GLAREA_01431 [Glarea lozoyensis ATCC 20868]